MSHKHSNDSALQDVLLLEYERYDDLRGSLSPLISSTKLVSVPGFQDFEIKQINSVTSKFGAIRGIHASSHLWPQRKIVFCIAGQITDVIVDLCPFSESFGKAKSFELSGEFKVSLALPACVGHSFQTKSTYSVVNYLLDREYNPTYEVNVNPMSKSLNIQWINPFVLSDKDATSPFFDGLSKDFFSKAEPT